MFSRTLFSFPETVFVVVCLDIVQAVVRELEHLDASCCENPLDRRALLLGEVEIRGKMELTNSALAPRLSLQHCEVVIALLFEFASDAVSQKDRHPGMLRVTLMIKPNIYF